MNRCFGGISTRQSFSRPLDNYCSKPSGFPFGFCPLSPFGRVIVGGRVILDGRRREREKEELLVRMSYSGDKDQIEFKEHFNQC